MASEPLNIYVNNRLVDTVASFELFSSELIGSKPAVRILIEDAWRSEAVKKSLDTPNINLVIGDFVHPNSLYLGIGEMQDIKPTPPRFRGEVD